MRFRRAPLFLLRHDIALRKLIQKIFQTKIFFGFLVKGPPLLDVITNIKQRGGLLVTTTMVIHCEEPVISAFLLWTDRVDYPSPCQRYFVSTFFISQLLASSSFFLHRIKHYLVLIKDKIRSSLCTGLNVCSFVVGRASAARKRP